MQSAKEVDAAVAAVLGKVQAVKGALSAFVGKMEHEQLTWWVFSPIPKQLCQFGLRMRLFLFAYHCRPSVLDSFTSVSGHMSTLMRQLGSEKIPSLHNRVILPLQVSSDKDFELEVTITSQLYCAVITTIAHSSQRSTDGRVPMFHHEIRTFTIVYHKSRAEKL